MAVEAPEVDVRADRRSPGRILPYREKSVAREIQNSKFKNTISSLHSYDGVIYILYGLIQCVASVFPPGIVPGLQEHVLLILIFEFPATMDFSR